MTQDPNALNETVFCRLDASPIEGVGVFAIRDINKGQELSNYYGVELEYFWLKDEDLEKLVPEVKLLVSERTLFQKDNDYIFMSPNSNQILQAFMNHSDNANSDGRFALRDIKKGEEVTEDYIKIVGEASDITKGIFKDKRAWSTIA